MSDLEEMLKETPTLTFEPFPEEKKEAVFVEEKKQEQVEEEIPLSEEEKKMVEQFSKQIDLANSNQVLQYGAGAQKKMADFSESALGHVKNKDLGEIGQMLSNVVMELKNFDIEEEEKGGLFGFFKKTNNRINTMKAKYAKAESNVTEICNLLEKHQIQLLKDVAVLDQLYELNKNYYKELTMYILAGKQKLSKVQREELPILMEKANRTGLPEDAQAVNDLNSLCNRFEKKIHDLELTRMISVQMAPQIRLVQNNDTTMSEKIQSTIVNTIPLWKSQMVLALGIAHSEQAVRAQREVTDMTNELLKKNAEALKMATVETARESERGIVDIETLKYTNESLISTLDEVLQIQVEGRQKRIEAESELAKIEGELKAKLLQYAKP
ncbi:MAG: toxic anion resistance protein [Clostridiales bacterium]|nr:toxic anion resistance protein [Clostridiales bacterium]